jgi:sulfur relay (sulfurtransferase) DsrC/TusE family protein
MTHLSNLDEEGYLIGPQDWNEEAARQLALRETSARLEHLLNRKCRAPYSNSHRVSAHRLK